MNQGYIQHLKKLNRNLPGGRERGIHLEITWFIKAPNRGPQSLDEVGGTRPSGKSGRREAKADQLVTEP